MLNFEKDLGFVILLTEFRFGGLRATTSTIGSNFNNAKCICVVPGGSDKEDMRTAKSICPLVEARETISSMINAGIEKSQKPWNLIVMSGNIMRYKPVMKYGNWMDSPKDIMYRAVDKTHWRWEDASIHGMMIHKEAMKEVGAFPEDEESLPMCKLIWGATALEKGYKLKGLVGIRLL